MTPSDRARLVELLRERLPEGCDVTEMWREHNCYHVNVQFPLGVAEEVERICSELLPGWRPWSGNAGAEFFDVTYRSPAPDIAAAVRELTEHEPPRAAEEE